MANAITSTLKFNNYYMVQYLGVQLYKLISGFLRCQKNKLVKNQAKDK